LLGILKKAGALVSNAGCAGCAAGQVGQNGQGEVTISTGNRNFPGKQGKGKVYLASPEVVAASSVAGYITTPDNIPAIPSIFENPQMKDDIQNKARQQKNKKNPGSILEGRIWIVQRDNIDTDMIFHNRYIAITDIMEMGRYTFDNLNGFEDFSGKAEPGDIIITGKNFGCGSSRQQAVDCFKTLGIQAIVAESFGVIYERNAINAAFPVLTCKGLADTDLKNGDVIRIDLKTGQILNLRTKKVYPAEPVSEVQFEIYQRGGLI
jgi:3-isopropylmalate/(R)-2-methylmalate dehydratase large subunit